MTSLSVLFVLKGKKQFIPAVSFSKCTFSMFFDVTAVGHGVVTSRETCTAKETLVPEKKLRQEKVRLITDRGVKLRIYFFTVHVPHGDLFFSSATRSRVGVVRERDAMLTEPAEDVCVGSH